MDPEAREIARATECLARGPRDAPVVMLADPGYLVVLEPNRPGMPRPVLSAAGSKDDLKRVFARWNETRTGDPQSAKLVLQAVRDRSSRVPTYAEVERVQQREGAALTLPDGNVVAVQEIAMPVTLHRFGDNARAAGQFTLPELAHYLCEFGIDQMNVEAVFACARHVLYEGRPAIVGAREEQRDDIAQWSVRLMTTRWLHTRRRGRS